MSLINFLVGSINSFSFTKYFSPEFTVTVSDINGLFFKIFSL